VGRTAHRLHRQPPVHRLYDELGPVDRAEARAESLGSLAKLWPTAASNAAVSAATLGVVMGIGSGPAAASAIIRPQKN